MKWDDLRFFLAVARSRTLAAAAQSLSVDATTVGRRLERLSANLGSTLFDMGPSGPILTSAGDELLRHAEEVERSIMAASNALTGERSRLAGTVRLSLSEGFATWVIARHLSSFAKAHPDIILEIVTTNGFLNPSKREADLAVMLARPARGPLKAQKLTDYHLGLYAARSYVAENGQPETKADMMRHRLIGYIPDFIYADELRYMSDVSDHMPGFSSSSINVQHAITRAGQGVAILPHFIGGQDDTLLPLLTKSVQIERTFWVVVHQDLARVARVRAVIDWMKQVVAQNSTLFSRPDLTASGTWQNVPGQD
jgi:DNA-binding transcriptional LysR family regulator